MKPQLLSHGASIDLTNLPASWKIEPKKHNPFYNLKLRNHKRIRGLNEIGISIHFRLEKKSRIKQHHNVALAICRIIFESCALF